MKQNKIKNTWFTLIELLVVITIIWIMALWISSISFNFTSNREKLRDFNYKITSNIESIRNNSLIWKWVGPSLIVPNSWQIDFIKTWTWGKILTYYKTGASLTAYPEYDIEFQKWYSFDSIRCLQLDWVVLETFSWATSWTGHLYIKWSSIFWSWSAFCNNINTRILEINTRYIGFTWSILINTVSWMIEKK